MAFVLTECALEGFSCTMFMLRKHQFDFVCMLYCMASFAIKTMEQCNFLYFIHIVQRRFALINDELSKFTNEVEPNMFVLVRPQYNVDNIEKMRKFHYELCGIGKEVNRVFSLTILIVVALTFIEFTNRCYYSFHMIQDCFSHNFKYDRRLMPTVVAVLLNAFELFMLSSLCNMVHKEVK